MAPQHATFFTPISDLVGDFVAILVTEEQVERTTIKPTKTFADTVNLNWVEKLLDDPRVKEDFKGKAGQSLILYPTNHHVKRVVFVGVGKTSWPADGLRQGAHST
eukprot:GABW01000234.1.p1 GENE.GABW01000234.1~~GABW01000234.1.p1  ORF type:complete len:105 (-),score=8.87 GABW01000234.1:3-317(-)